MENIPRDLVDDGAPDGGDGGGSHVGEDSEDGGKSQGTLDGSRGGDSMSEGGDDDGARGERGGLRRKSDCEVVRAVLLVGAPNGGKVGEEAEVPGVHGEEL